MVRESRSGQMLRVNRRLSSTIIEAVKTHTAALSGAALAYFYFDFNDAEKQRVKEFLCSFIAQLSQSTSRAAEKVQALYTRCQRGQQQPSMASLQICVREILEESPRTFLVLDALHECTEREELLDLIKELYSWRLPNVNVLATSRRELDIEQVLSPLSTCIIPIQSAKVDPDIRLYIDNRLHSDNKLKRWSKHADLMKEIETTLVDGADGMYATFTFTTFTCLPEVLLIKSSKGSDGSSVKRMHYKSA